MSDEKNNGNMRRRDFLAGVGIGALAAGMPMLPKAAIAASGMEAAPEGAEIARIGVYPALGIARVGGSTSWFLAPEVPGLPPTPEGGFKDGDQLIKKQVQRFRLFAFDAQNRVIGEVTSDNAEIVWNVHVANTKAAWYGFNNPLDNGELSPGLPGQKRNQFFVDDDERERMLVIDGGATDISGGQVNAQGNDPKYAMGGRFYDQDDVGLGHLRTDDAGRLLVFPPDGVSHSPVGANITSFADNDGWHDDWCDGPVKARVKLPDGRTFDADHGWVACVGPNFAPEIPPITTLYDVIEDMNVREGWSQRPSSPLSFRKHIYPIFRRLALTEWVSAESFLRQEWLGIGDFADPAFLAQLANPAAQAQPFRQSIFEKFRDPYNVGPEAYKEESLKIPLMLGDGVNYNGSPLQWFQFPKLQYDLLKSWADGDFINDLNDDSSESITQLEDIPLDQQPAALTQAALEPCSGGAFHPGVELSYYLRAPDIYARSGDSSQEPFRIALGNRESLIHNVGLLLTPEVAIKGGNGAPPPIGPQMPGDLTRWMGLPWQCDAFSCQQVLMQEDFPTAVWWPALLPIDVLPEGHYLQLLREDLPAEERLRFYHARAPWTRGVAGIGYHVNASYWDGITNMIRLWQHMGFVEKRPGPTDPSRPEEIPDELFVEVGRSDTELRFDWQQRHGLLPS